MCQQVVVLLQSCTCYAERHPVPENACWEKHVVGRWSEGRGWRRTGTRWWRRAPRNILYRWRSGTPSGPAAHQQQSGFNRCWHNICTEIVRKCFSSKMMILTGKLYYDITSANRDTMATVTVRGLHPNRANKVMKSMHLWYSNIFD